MEASPNWNATTVSLHTVIQFYIDRSKRKKLWCELRALLWRINYERCFSFFSYSNNIFPCSLTHTPEAPAIKRMANDNNSSANSMLRCQRKIIVIYRPNGVISKQTEIVACNSSNDLEAQSESNIKNCSLVAHPETAMKFMATKRHMMAWSIFSSQLIFFIVKIINLTYYHGEKQFHM